jgi:hypothetical protein
MANDPLEGAKLKVERANSHIREVLARVRSFRVANVCVITLKVEDDTGKQLVKLSATKKPSPDIAIVAGEILYNLRSALDHLVTCVATKRGITFLQRTGFPIERTQQKFEATLKKRKIEQRIPDLAPCLRELKPYQGGNDLLWWLHFLNAADKHQILMPMVYANVGWHGKLVAKSAGANLAGTWKSLDEDNPIVLDCSEIDERNIQLLADVTFRNINAVQPQPVVATLQQFVDLTRGIVKIFEDRFFKVT